MKSLMRRIKRRRTSYTDTEPESPSDTFELQSVPDHKKRSYRQEGSPNDEKEEDSKDPNEAPEPEILFFDPPAVILTTPEGLDIDTFAHDGLMDMVDEANDAEDEWDTLVPPPLLAEPPKTPTKRRPPPPRPERPAEVDLSFNTFVLGPPEKVEISHNSDSETTLVSPFADPEDTTDSEGEEEAASSWWSAWSSSSSSSDDASSDSSSSSNSSDSESEEMDMQYAKQTAGKTLYAQLIDGFISFPPLSPDDCENDDDDDDDDDHDKKAMKTFLDGLDEEDVRDAEELLRGEDVNDDDDGTAELIRTVASGESEWTNAFSRPVPRWWWLKSSNSFPVYRLGPGDLRHGPSKLRQAVSLVDEASLEGTVDEEEKVATIGVLYL